MFDHEKLDAYRVSITFVSWAYRLCKGLKGIDRHARDQLLRSSQSIPLNIAEGNGKPPSADRKRFFRIALGSALECAATIDVLMACEAIDAETGNNGKRLLVRIVSMLVRMSSVDMRVCEGVENENEYEYEYEYESGNGSGCGNEYGN